MLLVAGLMFGCEGDDVGDGHDHVHGEEDSGAFEAAANNLGVVFNDPVAAGRPSPSFNADILPILTNRCALPGCHVAGGPYGVDLRTYDTLNAGGDHAIVIASDARASEVVKQIVQGRMPPSGPPLEAPQTQLIIDWINEGAENN